MRVRRRARWWFAIGLVVVLVGSIALAVPRRPDLMAAWAIADIDGYPKTTKVTGCANPMAGEPGVAEFREMILSQVGGSDDGMAVCKKIANNSGSYSDHADGRAWDWHMRASSAADRATVDQVLGWLLRTDDRGRRNAMARRIGLTYIIRNHLYYRVDRDDAHWVPYTGTSDPHDTHVHFSFSVAGASRQTSWWTEGRPLVWSLPNRLAGPITLGQGPLRPLAGDWDGDGRDTPGAYNPATRQFSLWDAATAGASAATTLPLGPFGSMPFVGNWDGVGGDEVGTYDPMTRQFSFYFLSGIAARPTQVFGAVGDLPIAGDWDGDGVDDIGTYTPASRTFSLLQADGSVRTKVFGLVNDTPIVGDWNGDGVDDIGVFRSSSDTFWFRTTRSAVDDTDVVQSVRYGAVRHLPVVGDWDGNGTDHEGVVTD